MTHTCLVCSYPKLKSPPHSPSGGGSYEICPSCGYQYGVDDDDRGITPVEWRRTWIANGAQWSSQGIKPPTDWKFGDTAATAAVKSTPAKAPAKAASAKKSTPAAKSSAKTVKSTKSAPTKKAPVKKVAKKTATKNKNS
jgi:hypothetical protein